MRSDRSGRVGTPHLPGMLAALLILILLPGGGARMPGEHACRFWGLVGVGYSPDLITDHLRDGTITNLKSLGGPNYDGWGFASFLRQSPDLSLFGPLIRRGGPRANHPAEPEYDLAVLEIATLTPKAIVGHVRRGTSGHWGIPNPHPFRHEGMVFAHNGTIPESVLFDMLTQDDPDYLERHPPDYVEGYIDSELYFLCLLKYFHRYPKLAPAQALREAIRNVAARVGNTRLNFVLTAGDTLYALRCAPYDNYDPVRYYSAGPALTSSWVVASQIMGSTSAGWETVPPRTLAVFVPGQSPQFLAIDPGPASLELGDSSRDASVGTARPNPTQGGVVIPVAVPRGGAEVAVEITDIEGRIVWKPVPAAYPAGESEILWDGLDRSGRAVASGTYFCRVQVGDRTWRQSLSIVK